ncbi:hypothetical protein ACQKGI_23645 [Peribacillus muralis]|uniref:hypothetical protein n=1 Tax=Peribacillus muralis TaxID=264697 RepID=UPI003804C13E
MTGYVKLFIGLLLAFSLTGCFGEDYGFTHPSVTPFNGTNSEIDIKLKEANIDWKSDKEYKKETKDILSLARKQKLDNGITEYVGNVRLSELRVSGKSGRELDGCIPYFKYDWK